MGMGQHQNSPGFRHENPGRVDGDPRPGNEGGAARIEVALEGPLKRPHPPALDQSFGQMGPTQSLPNLLQADGDPEGIQPRHHALRTKLPLAPKSLQRPQEGR
jgi:hypothetical protein